MVTESNSSFALLLWTKTLVHTVRVGCVYHEALDSNIGYLVSDVARTGTFISGSVKLVMITVA